MTDLKNQFLSIEKDMKLIQKVTSIEEPNEVYDRYKTTKTKNEKIKIITKYFCRIKSVYEENTNTLENVNKMEIERNALAKKLQHADVIQQSLRHNLTDNQIE